MLSDNFLIFLDHGLDHLKFGRFQTMVLNQCNGEQSKFCTNVSFYNVNVYRFMVICIKQKSKSE